MKFEPPDSLPIQFEPPDSLKMQFEPPDSLQMQSEHLDRLQFRQHSILLSSVFDRVQLRETQLQLLHLAFQFKFCYNLVAVDHLILDN